MATVSHDDEVKYDGRLLKFNIPELTLPVCQACGGKLFTSEVESQFDAALRSHLGLLAPEEIQAQLDRLGLTVEQVAERTGIDKTTITLWIDDTEIQSKAMDNLLRLFFESPNFGSDAANEARDPK